MGRSSSGLATRWTVSSHLSLCRKRLDPCQICSSVLTKDDRLQLSFETATFALTAVMSDANLSQILCFHVDTCRIDMKTGFTAEHVEVHPIVWTYLSAILIENHCRERNRGFSFVTGIVPSRCHLVVLSNALASTVSALTGSKISFYIILFNLLWTGNIVLNEVFDDFSLMPRVEEYSIFAVIASPF